MTAAHLLARARSDDLGWAVNAKGWVPALGAVDAAK